MKRIKTRALALLLSCCLVTIGTIGSCQTAQAAEIVAGGAIVGTLEEILLSFGIFLLPSAMTDQAQSSDWWYSEDGNAALKPYYDDLASEYEKERFKVINGGGGDPQPSPTPVPEQKPEIQPTPIPQVKPGEIPTFDELVAPALAGGAISWASGAWDTMAKAVGNLWDKMFGRASDVSSDLPEDVVNTIMNSGCPYYYYDSPTDTPDQPESPEDEVKPYTVDLTKVFPFCIPFDLIHLFKVLDAEPEAPVFKIPIELQVDNPFNGKSIVDYKDTIVINLSDYEQPVKVIRVFEVIFFLIGLMLITRSHMIKG